MQIHLNYSYKKILSQLTLNFNLFKTIYGKKQYKGLLKSTELSNIEDNKNYN